jgi:small subunit ribosomal protein S19
MGRSIKKGPYVQPALFKKVVAMNDSGNKQVLKTWSRSSTISPSLLAIPSLFMTDASTSLFM